MEALPALLTAFERNSAPELAAVLLGLCYLLLAVRQHIACWYAAFLSTAIFLHVFRQANLYMEAALQVFYLAMAVYGWLQWRQRRDAAPLRVSVWPVRYHLAAIAAVLIATLVSGSMLSGTDQRLAYVDSFTTWGAIISTFMVARKILENWAYWLVVDGVSIFLYLDRGLYFTALLFAVYIVIIFFGWRAWWRDWRRPAPAPGTSR